MTDEFIRGSLTVSVSRGSGGLQEPIIMMLLQFPVGKVAGERRRRADEQRRHGSFVD